MNRMKATPSVTPRGGESDEAARKYDVEIEARGWRSLMKGGKAGRGKS